MESGVGLFGNGGGTVEQTLGSDDVAARTYLREVNLRIHELANFGMADASYVCECGRSSCRLWVELARDEFAVLVAAGGSVRACN